MYVCACVNCSHIVTAERFPCLAQWGGVKERNWSEEQYTERYMLLKKIWFLLLAVSCLDQSFVGCIGL